MQRPSRCAVIPFLGTSNSHGRGFIDTGQDLPGWDPHVYVSVQAVEEMAAMIGWQKPETVRHDELTTTRATLEQVEAELADCRAQIAAIGTLKIAGAIETRPVGRPRKVA